MLRFRLGKKILVKLEALNVWLWFRALRINFLAQSLKNILLISGKALIRLDVNDTFLISFLLFCFRSCFFGQCIMAQLYTSV